MDRDSLTPDGQPAYWTQRYRLRGAVTASAQAQARHQVDVPEFLASSKEAILVTGGWAGGLASTEAAGMRSRVMGLCYERCWAAVFH